MKNIMNFLIMMETLYRAAGVLTSRANTSVCQSLTANIDFNITLEGSTYGTGSESWYFGSTRIATNPSGTFTPQGTYSSRLSSYSTYGISLTGVTSTDAGEYSLVFAVIAPTFAVVTATAMLTVNIAPASSCIPYYNLTESTGKCDLNKTAVSNNECGSPILMTNWTNGLGTSDITNIATSGNYTCCAYGIAKNCYSGSYTFCETFSITVHPTASTTPTATTITMTTTTTTVSATNTETRTASIETTTSTEKTNTGMGTQRIKATSSCPVPVLVITGISVSGFLSILLIFIICCCCPCCCLYHCRKEEDTDKYEADLVETNDNGDVNNHIKAQGGTPNPAYVLINAPDELSTSDKFKEAQLDDGTLKVLVQSNRLAANPTSTSNKDWEDKPVTNKNEVIESEPVTTNL